MIKLDYSTMSVREGQPPTDYAGMLDRKGGEGWELVTVLPREGLVDFFFKRPAVLRQ